MWPTLARMAVLALRPAAHHNPGAILRSLFSRIENASDIKSKQCSSVWSKHAQGGLYCKNNEAMPGAKSFSRSRGLRSDDAADNYYRIFSETFEAATTGKSGRNDEQRVDDALLSRGDGVQLSHVDRSGRASMVDVGSKSATTRSARAVAVVDVGPEAYRLIRDNLVKKGDVLTVAQISGILAAKRTSELIPLCHPVLLSHVDVKCSLTEDPAHGGSSVMVTCEAKCQGQTGVEMEALVGASVAALTIYDMCKAVNKGIVVRGIRLLRKEGGKSGPYHDPRPDIS